MGIIAMRVYQFKLNDKNRGSGRLLEGVHNLYTSPLYFVPAYTSNSPSKAVFEVDDLGLHSYGLPLFDGF